MPQKDWMILVPGVGFGSLGQVVEVVEPPQQVDRLQLVLVGLFPYLKGFGKVRLVVL